MWNLKNIKLSSSKTIYSFRRKCFAWAKIVIVRNLSNCNYLGSNVGWSKGDEINKITQLPTAQVWKIQQTFVGKVQRKIKIVGRYMIKKAKFDKKHFIFTVQ